MTKPVQVTTATFKTEVTESTLPVLVDFWAAWCGPCRAIAPLLETLAQENDGKVKIAKVDIDAYPELANRFGVQSIPTLVAYKDGEEISRIIGNRAREIRELVENLAE
ncbi:MAG: thioredoxin [Bradymonadales bacterium]|jgi:thioredoxin 1